MTSPSSGPWSLAVESDVARLRFDDGRANICTIDGLTKLNRLLDDAEQAARVVILEGRPGVFSAGFDLSIAKVGGSELDVLLSLGARTLTRLLLFPRPVIANCTGHAIALGALFLLASDVRIGAEGPFKLGLNETAIGSNLPRFLLELARHRMPPPAFDEIIWGATFPPRAAIKRGYLDEVVTTEALEDRCLEHAERLAKLSSRLVARGKCAIRGPIAAAMLEDLEADLRLLNPGPRPT